MVRMGQRPACLAACMLLQLLRTAFKQSASLSMSPLLLSARSSLLSRSATRASAWFDVLAALDMARAICGLTWTDTCPS